MLCEKILGKLKDFDLTGKRWNMWILSGMKHSKRSTEKPQTVVGK